jgi:ankyrin repeat protein
MDERSPLRQALAKGDPAEVRRLLDAGADVRYRTADGYDALMDAVHGRLVSRDERLLELLSLLVERGAPLGGETKYRESGLRALSHWGRFDAVRVLLDAGADEGQLAWTPLLRAVALGSLADVRTAIDADDYLENTDWWHRTAFLIALRTGDRQKAELLLARGANEHARGNYDAPATFEAIDGDHADLLRWLLSRGHELEATDEGGNTALLHAVENGSEDCVDVLVSAGADLGRGTFESALANARTRRIALRLLDAGADPADLSRDGRRAILGFGGDSEESDPARIDATEDDYRRAWRPRFGAANAERVREPFWEAMIRAGVNAYAARKRFGDLPVSVAPVWCADRFGQSLTFLPDGRIVEIAGEHEDAYDPDFCIYNDVFVHGPDGSIAIYGYPADVFPPTDFHTATLVGDAIYVVGSLGYPGARVFGETQVFRLDVATFGMERLATTGDGPGWLSRHRARLGADGAIVVSGGKVSRMVGGKEKYEENTGTFALDLATLRWRREVGS